MRSKKALATKAALPGVNKQVRDEFLSTALLHGAIHTASLDFDFRHIVAFLNRLSDAELRALPSTNIPTQRKITIDLTVSDGCPRKPKYFDRWINRAGHPTKKGTNLDFQYKLVAGWVKFPQVTWLRYRSFPPGPRFPFWLRDYRLITETRQKEELGKILAALNYI